MKAYIQQVLLDKNRPFTILRPTAKYDLRNVQQALREIGNTSFSDVESTAAAFQRRALPRWGTDVMVDMRRILRPGASTAGTNCAGGVCRVLTAGAERLSGRGIYNQPADLRFMKEFKTVGDYLPESLLKPEAGWAHSGSTTSKTLANIKKYMRLSSRRTAGLGILAGLGLTGWGAHRLSSRSRPRLDLRELVGRKA
jgi:hypothetical protein